MESHGAYDLEDLSVIIGLPKQNFAKMSHNQTSGAILYILYIYIYIPLDPKTIKNKKMLFYVPKSMGYL